MRNSALILLRFEQADINRDGVIQIEGFKSALLIPEVNKLMKIADIEEAFYLSEDSDRGVPYVEWVKQNFPSLVQQFDTISNSYRTGPDQTQILVTEHSEQDKKLAEQIKKRVDDVKV